MAFYDFLPSVQPTLIDTPLVVDSRDTSPRVLIIGTAEKGAGNSPIPVASTGVARTTFGTGGNLLRGLYEVKAQGARNVVAMRVGGTSASVSAIGGADGWRVATDLFDDVAGDRFAIWYESSTGRLAVFDEVLGEWVYDSDGVLAPFATGVTITDPALDFAGGGTSIGTVSAPVLMSDITTEATYVAGSDGTSPSLMEMWENLFNAYQLLDFAEFDIVVPMGVHIDELNVVEMGAGEITDRALAGVSDYPTAGSVQDILGKVFTQENNGTNYFWWDVDDDGVAEIFPAAATATTDLFGNSLDASDFHEVNFAYELANFCHNATEKWQFCIGVISFKLPTGFSLGALASWLGKLPTFTTNPVTREIYVAGSADDGTGILGNKFLAGRSDWRSGVKSGGFIATDTGFLDGEELLDPEDNVVDIGKYINVVTGGVVHLNNFSDTGYVANFASSYGGQIATLVPQSAPANKVLKAIRLIKSLRASKVDQLAGVRVVTLLNKPKGIVISDSPTAARPASNFRRLTTVRIVKSVVGTVRTAADPFLGEPNSPAQQQALKTLIETALQGRVLDGSLRRFDFDVTATAQQRVLGQMVITMVLVPNFETQYIPLSITLASE